MSRRRTLLQSAFVLSTGSLGHRVASGAGYQFLGIALRTALTIGSTAILARLLSPSDFGYIAMATVITELAALFGAFGITNVLIQKRVISRLNLDTAFWATLGIGTTLTLVVVALSFFSRPLFADAQVAPLMRWLSLNFLLGSLTAVPWIVLSRLMRFRAEFWINITSVVVRIGAAVACAVYGLAVWSLVIGSLVSTLVSVALYVTFVPYVPRFRFQSSLIFATWRSSGGYLGNGLVHYLNMNMDLLLIGRYLGATSLGYYQNARSLTDEIRARIAVPIQHVLFPAFSALQSDPDRYREAVTRAARLLAAIVIPIGFGISVNAAELVIALYGERWKQMIPTLAMFGLSAALRASTALASPLFNASNRVGLGLRYNAMGAAVTTLLVIVAIPCGLNGVAMSVLGASFFSLIIYRAAFRLIGLDTATVLRVLGFPATAALVMCLATMALRRITTPSPVLLTLGVHVIFGAAVYLLTLHLLSRKYLHELVYAGKLMFRRR